MSHIVVVQRFDSPKQTAYFAKALTEANGRNAYFRYEPSYGWVRVHMVPSIYAEQQHKLGVWPKNRVFPAPLSVHDILIGDAEAWFEEHTRHGGLLEFAITHDGSVIVHELRVGFGTFSSWSVWTRELFDTVLAARMPKAHQVN